MTYLAELAPLVIFKSLASKIATYNRCLVVYSAAEG